MGFLVTVKLTPILPIGTAIMAQSGRQAFSYHYLTDVGDGYGRNPKGLTDGSVGPARALRAGVGFQQDLRVMLRA